MVHREDPLGIVNGYVDYLELAVVKQELTQAVNVLQATLTILRLQAHRCEEHTSEIGSMLGLVDAACETAAHLSGVVRSFTAPNSAESEKILDVSAQVRQVLRMCREQITLKAQLLESCEDMAFVSASPARFRQLILNMLVEAILALPDAAPSENAIAVHCTTLPNNEILLEVGVTNLSERPSSIRRWTHDRETSAAAHDINLVFQACRRIAESLGGTLERCELSNGVSTRVVLPGCAQLTSQT